MRLIIRNKSMGTTRFIRLLRGLFLIVLMLEQTASARIPIEQVQREFQGRYYFLTGQYCSWPPCPCGSTPAPAFPPDDFYGDLDKNPLLASMLVSDLLDKFYDS